MELRKESSVVINTVLYYNLVSSVILAFSIFCRYSLYLRWLKSRVLEFEFETLSSTGLDRYVALETFSCMFTPMPWLRDVKYQEYNIQFDST
jgi:hypothetical protein